MSITINSAATVFHLQTDHTSYIVEILPNQALGQVYYGDRIPVKDAYPNLTAREERGGTPTWHDDLPDFQPELVKTEYASFGKGDYRYPAFQLTQPNGSRISEFVYQDYQLTAGKQRLPKLPSTFDDTQDGAQTLTITLKDRLTGVLQRLNYAVFPHQDVIVRSATFENPTATAVTLNTAYSAQLDLPDDRYDFLQFAGDWARERHLYRNRLRPGSQSIASLRGASSAQENPFMMLARPETTETQGSAYGLNLVYSGNFNDSVEVNQFATSRVLIGINPTEFAWNLGPESTFQTPEAILSYTSAGLNQLSQQMGDFYQHHLVNSKFANQERPVLINNWEATYFDFDEAKLMTIVRQAHDLGIDMFVLDDGWFGHRNDDTTSLGDWFTNQPKFPQGLPHFCDQVHALDMQLGLWFEPEMVSKDSDLYRAHPDWLIGDPHAELTPSRHQFVLDMSRKDVVDYLAQRISEIIDETHLDYIKWDMNRNITEAFSHQLEATSQLELAHRYILGVYDLYDRLTQAYPDVLFESCASGGGRFDLGMMYYAPQAWTSDDTDAVERLKIQYGTSYGYPQAMMGAHVSAVPNEQNGRITSLTTRGAVAFFGDLGYELDITQMTPDELQQIKEQVAFYHQYRRLFQFGKFYRIDSPFAGDGNLTSWGVVAPDQSQGIFGRYQLLNHPNAPYQRQFFQGLDPKRQYRVNGGAEHFSGTELMAAGYFVPSVKPAKGYSSDFSAQLFIVEAV